MLKAGRLTRADRDISAGQWEADQRDGDRLKGMFRFAKQLT